jgi:hypothetical protein
MAGYCDCHLSNAVRRIYAKNPHVEMLVYEAKRVEKADPFRDAPLFDHHMRFEETYLRPHMLPADRQTMDTHHTILRNWRRTFLHEADARKFFDAHARWEQTVFNRLLEAVH